jgi:hypothetical protein
MHGQDAVEAAGRKWQAIGIGMHDEPGPAIVGKRAHQPRPFGPDAGTTPGECLQGATRARADFEDALAALRPQQARSGLACKTVFPRHDGGGAQTRSALRHDKWVASLVLRFLVFGCLVFGCLVLRCLARAARFANAQIV